MARTTSLQRHLRMGQPYTLVRAVQVPNVQATPAGPVVLGVSVFQIDGFTLELQFIDEDFQEVWEQHDLGQASTLPIAHDTARSWREKLVGEYDTK